MASQFEFRASGFQTHRSRPDFYWKGQTDIGGSYNPGCRALFGDCLSAVQFWPNAATKGSVAKAFFGSLDQGKDVSPLWLETPWAD
jgi:hypothetical protein